METIHAWIYNPDHALFKGQSKKAALFTLHCENPDKCDLRNKHNRCLNQDAFGGCKFGRKFKREGFTRRARNYHSWITEAKEDNADYFEKLTSKTYSGIFKTGDHWHLPYSFMDTIWGSNSPLQSKWVHIDDMTAELLERICTAQPRAMMGDVINKYQNDVVPKFLHDIKTHYPKLFELLSESQKKRVETISFVGREADIKTCAAGSYKMGTEYWEWDGKKLIGGKMLFQPAKGNIRIEIEPDDGQSVKITSNDQVTPETVFLD